jgi:2-polyprenyl-3-methyl-5-hydroxy-6-metoxy-1,4-benzoquinol methylase
MDEVREEGKAFDKRIEERIKHKFVPDLRRAVKCEYFYKSFWRDPYFINLYVKEYVDNLVHYISKYTEGIQYILDIGCGPGFSTLEIARAGHNVIGIDVSELSIKTAIETLKNNPHKESFGSLEYKTTSFGEFNCDKKFDVIVCVGSLHHMLNLDEVLVKINRILKKDGLFLCYEPNHEEWRFDDSAQVALIRELLAITGHWHEPSIIRGNLSLKEKKHKFEEQLSDIHEEYLHERDKNEEYQSPNDNHVCGSQIIASLRKHFNELVYGNGFSFIYRMLGGIRGEESTIKKIADLLYIYDRLGVEQGYMRPNAFYFVGRNSKQ